ncbi:hypothetical protein DFH09DRAFT_1309031 [Mycena vulgaris]|nr:hypothetical protein DFH09DRAFT_1309031 [Mycena vulgaris]
MWPHLIWDFHLIRFFQQVYDVHRRPLPLRAYNSRERSASHLLPVSLKLASALSISLARLTIRAGCLLVYGVTSRRSSENVRNWLADVRAHADAHVGYILVGKKVDFCEGDGALLDGALLFLLFLLCPGKAMRDRVQWRMPGVFPAAHAEGYLHTSVPLDCSAGETEVPHIFALRGRLGALPALSAANVTAHGNTAWSRVGGGCRGSGAAPRTRLPVVCSFRVWRYETCCVRA